MPQPSKHRSTAGGVADILRQRILEGHYPSGKFLRQNEIAVELGVSRIPVREALALLEAEGLVVSEKFRGALVRKLTFNELEEIYDLRLMIEPYLLRHAIERIGAAEIADLRTIVTQGQQAKDLAEWASFNLEFHRRLFQAAGKPLALRVLDNLLLRADRYLKLQRQNSATTRKESDAEHLRILAHVENREVEEALAVLRKHISWNAQDVSRTIFDDVQAGSESKVA
ncbi:MAG: GntR family transcriptional regulator [Sphingobium sp.]